MNLKILPAANEDLINGYHFYERQASGLGSYFLDSLFSDIDSLIIYYGIHPKFLVNTTACFPGGFHLRYITR